MKIVFVPFKGARWFWFLADPDLHRLRRVLAETYGPRRHVLFDGIYGLICEPSSKLPLDVPAED